MPDAVWAVAQIVPSPEIVVAENVAHFGLRWQVTPILYSFGIHRGQSPWRAFIAEPFVRQVGSIEGYVSPEYVSGQGGDMFSLRFGTRAYFPLLSHGEYLSVSLGTSYSTFASGGVGYELGAYVLFGIFGVQLTTSPTPGQPSWIATLRFRYF